MSRPQPFEQRTHADCTQRSGSSVRYSSTRAGHSPPLANGVRPPQTSVVRAPPRIDRSPIIRSGATVNATVMVPVLMPRQRQLGGPTPTHSAKIMRDTRLFDASWIRHLAAIPMLDGVWAPTLDPCSRGRLGGRPKLVW